LNIVIIGSGKIGSNIGRRAAEAGHTVVFSFSRNQASLELLANTVGYGSTSGYPREAKDADIVVLSVPWDAIDTALDEAGSLRGKIVVDTTNHFAGISMSKDDAMSTGEHNEKRMPGARVVKAFNTLTSKFQSTAKTQDGVTAMFISGDDKGAKEAVSELVRTVGFEPVDLGGWKIASLMDAPRRDGAVYGEAYAPDDARQIANAAAKDIHAASDLAIRLKR
jgi:8-hydroxy-5-deazaflavin:NADPH oxidoreductase